MYMKFNKLFIQSNLIHEYTATLKFKFDKIADDLF